jgi:hypothetical protein
VSRVRYELGFYIPEAGILNGHRCENFKCYSGPRVFKCRQIGTVKITGERPYILS